MRLSCHSPMLSSYSKSQMPSSTHSLHSLSRCQVSFASVDGSKATVQAMAIQVGIEKLGIHCSKSRKHYCGGKKNADRKRICPILDLDAHMIMMHDIPQRLLLGSPSEKVS